MGLPYARNTTSEEVLLIFAARYLGVFLKSISRIRSSNLVLRPVSNLQM